MGFDGTHIVDKFGRVHDYLRISLTERCNLRCFYCMPEEGIELRDKAEFMTTEELLNIAREFVALGVKKIRLTGGEPLIKKGFDFLIKELGKMPVELAITTNGILIDQYLEDLKEAGVKNINVSLDSLREERFNKISRRNYFTRIRENIDLLLQHDFNLKINVVLMRGVNDDEILDFINWTRESKIHVRFIEFMPFDGNNWNSEKKVAQQEALAIIQNAYGAGEFRKIDDQQNDTAKNYAFHGAQGTFGFISSVTNPFCSTCNRIRLTADGKIKNCLFSQSETDLLSAYRSGEPLKMLILNSIDSKYEQRGGIGEFDNKTMLKFKNRSMVRIGG